LTLGLGVLLYFLELGKILFSFVDLDLGLDRLGDLGLGRPFAACWLPLLLTTFAGAEKLGRAGSTSSRGDNCDFVATGPCVACTFLLGLDVLTIDDTEPPRR
jgi:hypothetical protein